jgi:hypothetical protein
MKLRAVAFSVALYASLGGCSDKPAQPPNGEEAVATDSPVTASSKPPKSMLPGASPMQPDLAQPPPQQQPRSSIAPAPIQGGTLLVTRDGSNAVSSDPDRDRVVIVDLVGAQVLATLAMNDGDEPGRLVEDDAHRAHVVLRRAGQVAAIDIEKRSVLSRRDVCSAPQGIAYDGATQMLHVACGDGQLVTLPADGGDVTRRVHVDSDLRDVIVAGDKLYVTRFKNAELLELDSDGHVASRVRPAMTQGPFVSPSIGVIDTLAKAFEPVVAWRTVIAPDGRFAIVHQRAQVDEIALHAEAMSGAGGFTGGAAGGFSGSAGVGVSTGGRSSVGGSGGAGGGFAARIAAPQPAGGIAPNPVGGSGSAYGSGVGCDGIVPSGVTFVDGKNSVNGPVIPGLVLPVDAAISPDGQWLAIAAAGSFQSHSGFSDSFGAVVMPMGLEPKPDDAAFNPPSGASDSDAGVEAGSAPFGGGSCLMPGRDAPGYELQLGQVVAVAFDPQGRLVAQTRDPNRIRVLELNQQGCLGCETYAADIDLGGVPRRDPGHDLFHANAGGGLACASCHPGGGDDGHTWRFEGVGARRTQLFNMGIRDTLPLHWNGEFANLNELLLDVFVQRMGGQTLALSEGEALADYLDSLHPNAPIRSPKDKAALRGKTLFESAQVECSTCHSGPKLTNNKTLDVGTGDLFQVPSLIGVAYHQPYMHDGCAQTLRDRFEPSCGGATHGKTAGLSSDQIDDLVAYLESL